MYKFYKEAVRHSGVDSSTNSVYDRPQTVSSKRDTEKLTLNSTFDHALYTNFLNNSNKTNQQKQGPQRSEAKASSDELELARSSLRLLKSKMGNTSRLLHEDQAKPIQENNFRPETAPINNNQNYRKTFIPSFDEGEIARKTKELSSAVSKGYTTPVNQSLQFDQTLQTAAFAEPKVNSNSNYNNNSSRMGPTQTKGQGNNREEFGVKGPVPDERPAYTKNYSKAINEQSKQSQIDELDRTYTGSNMSLNQIKPMKSGKQTSVQENRQDRKSVV